MQITVIGKHVDATEAIKNYAHDKATKLLKYFNGIMKIEIILDVDGGHNSAEVIITAKKIGTIVAKEQGDDLYAAVDLATDKAERQITKNKEKLQDKRETRVAEAELTQRQNEPEELSNEEELLPEDELPPEEE